MFQDVGLKVLYISWGDVDDEMESSVWTVGKQSFFQAIIEQTSLVFPQLIHLSIGHLQQNIHQYRDPER